MVYGTKSRGRGKSRRGNRTLTPGYIFGNKGAKAQAKQINSLRKRINFVYNQCKPEVKTIESNPVTLTLQQNPLNGLPYHLYKVELPELGVEDNARIGNACNLLDSHIFMNMRMAYIGDVNYQLNGLGQTVNSTIRIVPFMVKSASDTQPDPYEILNLSGIGNIPLYRMNSIGPFNEGVSAKYHILGDYRYNMSMDDRTLINSKIRIKGSMIKKYVDTQYNTVGKASIYLLVTWNGLDPITFQSETLATPAVYITLSDKTAFTDP